MSFQRDSVIVRWCLDKGSPNVFAKGPQTTAQTVCGPDMLRNTIVSGYVTFY